MANKKKVTLTESITTKQTTQVEVEISEVRVLDARVDFETGRSGVRIGYYTAAGAMVKDKQIDAVLTEKVLEDLEDNILDAAIDSKVLKGAKHNA